MNSKDKGDITEAVITAEFMKNGIIVLEPRGDNQRYDLVIDTGNSFLKIQCKTGRYTDGKIIFSTDSSHYGHKAKDSKYVHSAYTKDEVDYFAVYCPKLDTSYLIKFEDSSKSSCTLRVEESRQTKGIRWAKDYLFNIQVALL